MKTIEQLKRDVDHWYQKSIDAARNYNVDYNNYNGGRGAKDSQEMYHFLRDKYISANRDYEAAKKSIDNQQS